MTIQLSTAARNALLDAIETAIGTAAIVEIRTGAPPANCAAADTGTVLATINTPSDYLANASGGSKAILGTWQDLLADASGTAGHFRVKNSGGTTCHMQGTITSVATGTGDMLIDNPALVTNQPFSITTFTLTAPGA